MLSLNFPMQNSNVLTEREYFVSETFIDQRFAFWQGRFAVKLTFLELGVDIFLSTLRSAPGDGASKEWLTCLSKVIAVECVYISWTVMASKEPSVGEEEGREGSEEVLSHPGEMNKQPHQ